MSVIFGERRATLRYIALSGQSSRLIEKPYQYHLDFMQTSLENALDGLQTASEMMGLLITLLSQ